MLKKNLKVIITGVGGYIGSVSTYLFLKNGYEVIGIDNFSRGYHEPLNFFEKEFGRNKFRYYSLDLGGSLDYIFEKEKGIDAVVHYAAFCSVDESIKNPQIYFTNNVCATQNLLTTLLKYKINNIVFSSTCAVYGESQYVPMDEKHPTNPLNTYGASKRMIEQMMEWYGKLSGLNYVILRYFNVCGASDDGLIGDSKKPSTALMQNAVRGALKIEPFYLTCPKVDTPDKSPIRDYINVVDLNLAHLKAVEYLLKGGKNEIFNLGTGKGNSVLEIVNKVQKKTKAKFDIKRSSPRQGEYAAVYANIEKAKKVLNWKPERSIDDSINSLVKWYKSHPQGWKM